MSDIIETYYDDLKEKNSVARSARAAAAQRYKKNRIPTQKELNAMNGETYELNLNAFMPYEDFEKLPAHLQKEYLANIVLLWKVGPIAIAEMWGKSKSTISFKMRQLGIKCDGRKTKQADTDEFFQHFVREKRHAMPKEPKPTKQTQAQMQVSDILLTFDGLYNEQQITKTLRAIIPDYKAVRISISITADA